MSAPVKNTCPDIDKALNLIEHAMRVISRRSKEISSRSDEDDVLWEILGKIEDVPSILEDLRKDNDALRSWGHELEEQLESAAYEIGRLEKLISQQ